ncbi:MAG: NUDIX domain-containing protein [Pseudomonadota bacterium]
MSAIFLYGTLRYRPLLDIVAGREVDARPARLPGHAVFWAGEESYPRIAEADGIAEGLLIDSDAAAARIDFYEGGYGYAVKPVTVETEAGPVAARMYWPGADVPAPGAPWSLDAWIADWGRMTLHVAEEAMGYYGEIRPEALAGRMSSIRARAHSRVLAGTFPTPTPLGPLPEGSVETEVVRRPYTNFFSVREDDLRHPLFKGSLGPLVTRAAFISADASVVLPYDPVRDRVHLIEQFRMGPHFRGDPNGFLIEAVAGRVDPGETPEEAAHREAREEAGLTLSSLHLVSRSYPSPGAFTELLHIFIGIADLPDGTGGIGGLQSEAEDIRSTVIPFAEFEKRLDEGGLNVGPLIIAGLWLARHRERLRAQA